MLEGLETLIFNGLLMLNGQSYLWKPGLFWLHIFSNSSIALFYFSITIVLLYFAYQRRNSPGISGKAVRPYAGIFLMFGAFTTASSTTHLLNIWRLSNPDDWLVLGIEAITAAMALLAGLLAVLFLPKVLAQPRFTPGIDVGNQALTEESSDFDKINPSDRIPPEVPSSQPSQIHPLNTELEQRVNEQIAALQRNNDLLKTQIDGQKRWSEELSLLQSLTQLINEAPDFQSALYVALCKVCQVTNWDYGEVWLPNSENTVLECSPAWYGNTTTLEPFRQASEKLTFSPNTGLPGRVWSSRQPQWIEDISVQPDASCVRPQAQVAGLKAGFGIPIVISVSDRIACAVSAPCCTTATSEASTSSKESRVLAILTFFMTQSRVEDKRYLELVTAVATQLGLVLGRKQLEEELRQERDFSKTLIETSSAFFVALDADGKIIMMNQGFLDAVGYTLDEALGTDYLLTFVPEAERKSLAKIFRQSVRSQQPILKENYVLTKDGRKLLVEWRGKPIFKKSGELDFFFAVGIDITERKQLEEELRANKERYRAIVEEQIELICRFVPDGTLTFVNDAYCRYFGKTSEELLGRSLFEVIPEQYREKTQKHIATLSLKNAVATRDDQVVLQNGAIHWLQWTDQVIVDSEGQIVEFQSIGRDITERQRSVKESARLASMPLLSPSPIVETDLAGQVRYLNPEAMRLLPDLQSMGAEHPFLAGVLSMKAVLQRDGSIAREVKIDEVYYEQVLHYIPEIECLRIYAFDISDRKLAEQQLIYNAFYDQLTGLPNRALLMDRVRQTVQRSKQSCRSNFRGQPYLFAVLFLNLNRFKLVNDSFGSKVGDQLLQNFARRLETCLRPTDTLARLGADEFAILLEGIQDVSDATRVADAINQTLNLPFYLNESEVFMTVSIGIALGTSNDDSDRTAVETQETVNSVRDSLLQAEDLLRHADLAMYRARSQGKACYEVFDAGMHELSLDRLQLETDLRRAIERKEFQVYYQPIVSLSTGKIIGFEALLRWQHPQRGMVSPNQFISTAEETGLITPIGWWTLREACLQLKEWQEQFPDTQPLTMNVNLSAKQFNQPDLLDQIDNILQETQLAVGSLKLEITESVVMENPDWVKDVLLQLKKRNIHLCIDDFGTGYSSLSRLHHFPISTLKIDRSFVSRIGALGENSEIVQAIVTLAQTLRMDVVAEGIELSEQVSPLLALQCEYGQGFFFSKPVDSEAARQLLMAELQQRGSNPT